jgi:hypothetical protein
MPGPAEFMCERGGVYCRKRISLTPEAFAAILAADQCYLMASGHDGSGTDLVGYGARYRIVVVRDGDERASRASRP